MTPFDRIAIVNARIHTGNPRRPWAEALVVHEGRIEVLGSSAEVRKRIAKATRVIDARGMLVMPGWTSRDMQGREAELVEMLHAAVRGDRVDDMFVLDVNAPANLVILDRDITRATSGDAGAARAVLIIEAGRVVVDRAGLG